MSDYGQSGGLLALAALRTFEQLFSSPVDTTVLHCDFWVASCSVAQHAPKAAQPPAGATVPASRVLPLVEPLVLPLVEPLVLPLVDPLELPLLDPLELPLLDPLELPLLEPLGFPLPSPLSVLLPPLLP